MTKLARNLKTLEFYAKNPTKIMKSQKCFMTVDGKYHTKILKSQK